MPQPWQTPPGPSLTFANVSLLCAGWSQMLPELSEVVGSASLSVASVVDLVLGRVHHVLEHIHDAGAVAFRELQLWEPPKSSNSSGADRHPCRTKLHDGGVAGGQLREQYRVVCRPALALFWNGEYIGPSASPVSSWSTCVASSNAINSFAKVFTALEMFCRLQTRS